MYWKQFVPHLQALLAQFDASPALAADEVLAQYRRAHAELGARDRAQLADAFFAVLRQRGLWSAWVSSAGEPAPGEGLALLAAHHLGWSEMLADCAPAQQQWLARACSQFEAGWGTLAQRLNLPDWLVDDLVSQGVSDIEALAQSLNQAAPLDVRVNVHRAKRDKLMAEMRDQAWPAQPMVYSPWGLRLAQRRSLKNTAWFESGALEVQDEGSQLLAALVGAKRGETVVDFCAGAGGKTLALGAMMRDQGRLMAMDVSAARLAAMAPRLQRAGLRSVYTMALSDEGDARLQAWRGKAQRVLVDAPCSGLGTLRRSPELKWRLQAADISAYATRQRQILESAARLVQPGGRLVYATCSLLRDENEEVAEAFGLQHPMFVPVAAHEALASTVKSPELRAQLCADPYLRLWPHVHGTDGFFAAVWQRVD